MPARDKILAALETVHAAGLGAEPWPVALNALAGLFGSRAATLERFALPSGCLREYHAAGVPLAHELQYLDHYAAINPRAAYGMRHPDLDLQFDYLMIDEAQMARDAYYSEFMPQVGLRYFISGQVRRSADEMAIFAIQRTPKQGHVGKTEIALMRLLLPHVRQAFETAMRLRSADAVGQLMGSALDWLSDGVALLGKDGTVLYANDALLAIVARNDGIHIESGCLRFAASESSTRLEAAFGALARFASGDPAAPGGADFLVARRSDGPPYLASLRPRARGDGNVGGAAVAILFVRDALARAPAGIQAVREIFGFTEAEAALAQALMAGLAPQAYARRQALSPNTIYTHLRRIKEKTGCRRLTDLIHKLNNAQLAIRSGGSSSMTRPSTPAS